MEVINDVFTGLWNALVPVIAGMVVTVAVPIIRSLLLDIRGRLEAVGKVAYDAIEKFKASKYSPPELDALIDAILNQHRVLSRDVWNISSAALSELEQKARTLQMTMARDGQ